VNALPSSPQSLDARQTGDCAVTRQGAGMVGFHVVSTGVGAWSGCLAWWCSPVAMLVHSWIRGMPVVKLRQAVGDGLGGIGLGVYRIESQHRVVEIQMFS
jgi:hypothetical protein